MMERRVGLQACPWVEAVGEVRRAAAGLCWQREHACPCLEALAGQDGTWFEGGMRLAGWENRLS